LKYNLPIPAEDYYKKSKNTPHQIINDFDKENIVIFLKLSTGSIKSKDILPELEKISIERKHNELIQVLIMIAKSMNKIDFDKKQLEASLRNEYSYTISMLRWLVAISSGPEFLEMIKISCEDIITSDDPFYLIKNYSYTDPNIVDKLLEIASIFAKKGDNIIALNQVRNACTVAGAYGNGLTKDLCKTLADYTKKVEPDGLAYHLANFAVDVIDLGP
jgi:hypothetical protein